MMKILYSLFIVFFCAFSIAQEAVPPADLCREASSGRLPAPRNPEAPTADRLPAPRNPEAPVPEIRNSEALASAHLPEPRGSARDESLDGYSRLARLSANDIAELSDPAFLSFENELNLGVLRSMFDKSGRMYEIEEIDFLERKMKLELSIEQTVALRFRSMKFMLEHADEAKIISGSYRNFNNSNRVYWLTNIFEFHNHFPVMSELLRLLDHRMIPLLVKEHIRMIDPAVMASLRLEQKNAFIRKQIRDFSPAQVSALGREWLLTSDMLSVLTPAQIQGLSLEQVEVLLSVRSADFTQSQIQTLKVQRIKNLDQEAVQALSAQEILGLTPLEAGALTVERGRFFNSEQLLALADSNIPYLQPEWAVILPPEKIPHLVRKQIIALPAESIALLSPAQAQAFRPEQMRLFLLPQAKALIASHSESLTIEQWRGLDRTHFLRFPYEMAQKLLERNRAGDEPIFTPEQSSALQRVIEAQSVAPAQSPAPSLAASPLPKPDEIPSMSIEWVRELTANKILEMSLDHIRAMTAPQIQALSPSLFQHVSPKKLKALSLEQVRALPKRVVEGFSIKQIQALSGEQISAFLPEVAGSLPMRWMRHLRPDQTARLTLAQLSEISPRVFNREQIRSIAPEILSLLPVEWMGALSPSQFKALTREQVEPLSLEQLVDSERYLDLAPEQVPALSADKAWILSPDLIPYLTADQIRALSLPEIENLTLDQAKAFTVDQVKFFTRAQAELFIKYGEHLEYFQLNALPQDLVRIFNKEQRDKRIADLQNQQPLAGQPERRSFELSPLAPKPDRPAVSSGSAAPEATVPVTRDRVEEQAVPEAPEAIALAEGAPANARSAEQAVPLTEGARPAEGDLAEPAKTAPEATVPVTRDRVEGQALPEAPAEAPEATAPVEGAPANARSAEQVVPLAEGARPAEGARLAEQAMTEVDIEALRQVTGPELGIAFRALVEPAEGPALPDLDPAQVSALQSADRDFSNPYQRLAELDRLKADLEGARPAEDFVTGDQVAGSAMPSAEGSASHRGAREADVSVSGGAFESPVLAEGARLAEQALPEGMESSLKPELRQLLEEPWQISRLSMQELSPELTPHLREEHIVKLTPYQLRAFTPQHYQALRPHQMEYFESGQVEILLTRFNAFALEQISHLPIWWMEVFTKIQIRHFLRPQMREFSAKQLNVLILNNTHHLSYIEARALTVGQLEGLSFRAASLLLQRHKNPLSGELLSAEQVSALQRAMAFRALVEPAEMSARAEEGPAPSAGDRPLEQAVQLAVEASAEPAVPVEGARPAEQTLSPAEAPPEPAMPAEGSVTGDQVARSAVPLAEGPASHRDAREADVSVSGGAFESPVSVEGPRPLEQAVQPAAPAPPARDQSAEVARAEESPASVEGGRPAEQAVPPAAPAESPAPVTGKMTYEQALQIVREERRRRNFLPFEEAREQVRAVKLSGMDEFWNWRRRNHRNIPSRPDVVYADKGFTTWDDFLGRNTSHAMSLEEIQAVPPQQARAWTKRYIEGLNTDQVRALTLDQMRAFLPGQMAYFTPAQFRALSFRQLMTLLPAQVEAIFGEQMAEVLPEKMEAFSIPQIRAFPPRLMRALTPEQLGSFTLEQLRGFSPEQAQLLTEQQMEELSLEHLEALFAP